MLKNRKQLLLLGIVNLLAIGLTTKVVQAQSLRVSPMILQNQAEKGQARGLIEFTNVGNQAFRARIYTGPFTYNREGIEVLKTSPNDLTPYLTFSPRELVIEPNQTRTIRLNARFAPSVPDGEYRALLYAEQLTEIDLNKPTSNVAVKARLGITVYVTKGELSPQLKVEQADYNLEKRQIKLLVSNSGAVTARPGTNWRLTQAGLEIATGKQEEMTVIAQGDRYLTIPYPPKGTTLKAGTYQFSGQLNWSFPQAGSLNFDVPLNISEQDAKTVNLSQTVKP